jgi:Glyoxalase-like domain
VRGRVGGLLGHEGDAQLGSRTSGVRAPTPAWADSTSSRLRGDTILDRDQPVRVRLGGPVLKQDAPRSATRTEESPISSHQPTDPAGTGGRRRIHLQDAHPQPMGASRRRRGRVTGIGGVFLKSRSPAKLASWYRKNMGLELSPGGQFLVWDWRSTRSPPRVGSTVWAAMGTKDREWGAGQPTVELNYRVENLDLLLSKLRRAGVKVADQVDDSSLGRFAWAIDPEGNRFELWEPTARSRSSKDHRLME